MRETYPFQLKPLPYAYDALEPHIDEETAHIHHDKHLQTYVDNLNKALESQPALQDLTLEELILKVPNLPDSVQTAVNNNAGGVYNHNFYFDGMTGEQQEPAGKLKEAIVKHFGSVDTFRAELKKAALGQFGSGWAWLIADPKGCLKIMTTSNQNTPLPFHVYPILTVDVWEHAYYLKYQNRRADYLDQWFYLIDWKKADNIFEEAMTHADHCLHS